MKWKITLLAAVACFHGRGEALSTQLFIHVYPSRTNPTSQTIWIFSGSTISASDSRFGQVSIRTSADSNNYNIQDSWNFSRSTNEGNFYDANRPPAGTNFQLSPLFSSTNTLDIESIQKRIPGSSLTDLFTASATNVPTITIGSGSRTISHLFMDANLHLDLLPDSFGIRVSGSSLSYSGGASSAWVGAGLINKPIGDFFAENSRRTSPGLCIVYRGSTGV